MLFVALWEGRPVMSSSRLFMRHLHDGFDGPATRSMASICFPHQPGGATLSTGIDGPLLILCRILQKVPYSCPRSCSLPFKLLNST